MKKSILIILLLFISAACTQTGESTPPPPAPEPVLGAGFRYSSYGPWYDPGPHYWAGVGTEMAGNFPQAIPQAIWIVGVQSAKGTALNFPATTEEPYIFFAPEDRNEEVLTLFDKMGGQIWLQVEPGEASVEALIHLLLDRYGHHPSVIGVGIDVEWYGTYDKPEGIPVTDEVARAWVAAAREHGSHYKIFLKHWLPEYMPPTYRDGLVFVDDSQEFDSLEAMVAEFKTWGETFSPSPVGYQYGYPSDKHWWKALDNPPADIGNAILAVTPNTQGLYWVDFTVLEVFPPKKE